MLTCNMICITSIVRNYIQRNIFEIYLFIFSENQNRGVDLLQWFERVPLINAENLGSNAIPR